MINKVSNPDRLPLFEARLQNWRPRWCWTRCAIQRIHGNQMTNLSRRYILTYEWWPVCVRPYYLVPYELWRVRPKSCLYPDIETRQRQPDQRNLGAGQNCKLLLPLEIVFISYLFKFRILLLAFCRKILFRIVILSFFENVVVQFSFFLLLTNCVMFFSIVLYMYFSFVVILQCFLLTIVLRFL